MGSIRIHPEKAVVTTGSYVVSFVSRCRCGLAQQPRSPHLLINMTFRPMEFRKKSFTDLSQRFSRVEPLRSLPCGPRNSYTESAAPNSDDGVQRGDESESTSPESSSESQRVCPPVLGEKQKQDSKNAAQSALERAAAYKKLKKLGSSSTAQSGQSLAPPKRPETDLPDIEIIRGQNVQSRLQPTNSFGSSLSESSTSTPPGSSSPIPDVGSARESATPTESQDADNIDVGRFIEVKMAAERVKNSDDGPALTAVPSKGKLEPVSLAAFERAKGYKQQQEELIAVLRGEAFDESSVSSAKEGSPDQSAGASNEKAVEIEIVTRDGVIKRKVMNPEEQMRAFSNIKDVKRKGVSGIDFAGLGFADKKQSGRSAGLSEGFVAPPTGALPEVEILTWDAGSPQTESAEQSGQDAEQLYKPRVSTWGVFPRPADISKAYGGGRTIRPGESLETEEERQVREARTQKLLADYRKKMGLDVDPKIKAEAEQVFKQGDGLMDNGRLREALRLYESAMNTMPAQSELHGRAALQAAVCLDSLSRYDEARQVYERLLAHPNGAVKKQARRFLFGFTEAEMKVVNVEDQTPAMEKLKVDEGYKWDTSPYRKYFDSFAEDGYNTSYKAEDGEEANENVLPYALLLLCPILLVFALAASRLG